MDLNGFYFNSHVMNQLFQSFIFSPVSLYESYKELQGFQIIIKNRISFSMLITNCYISRKWYLQ